MICPKCGNGCYDNRGSKRSEKQPDFKCKDKQCNTAGWITESGKDIAFKIGDSYTYVPVDEKATYQGDTSTGGKAKPIVAPGFYSAWAKDLAVICLEKGISIEDAWAKFEVFFDKFTEKFTNLSEAPVQAATASSTSSTSASSTAELPIVEASDTAGLNLEEDLGDLDKLLGE